MFKLNEKIKWRQSYSVAVANEMEIIHTKLSRYEQKCVHELLVAPDGYETKQHTKTSIPFLWNREKRMANICIVRTLSVIFFCLLRTDKKSKKKKTCFPFNVKKIYIYEMAIPATTIYELAMKWIEHVFFLTFITKFYS